MMDLMSRELEKDEDRFGGGEKTGRLAWDILMY